MIYISECYIKTHKTISFEDLLRWRDEQIKIFELDTGIKIVDVKTEEKFRKWLSKKCLGGKK